MAVRPGRRRSSFRQGAYVGARVTSMTALVSISAHIAKTVNEFALPIISG
jgi:hypothetical protein